MIKLIACIDNNKAIGKDGKLLYHLAEDMQYFKKLTTEKLFNAVIMGRKTAESLPDGKPLKNRWNMVVSKSFSDNGFDCYKRLCDALYDAERTKGIDAWIIGGGQIYKEAIEKAIPEMLYITKVEATTKDADTFFPEFEDKYELCEKSEVHDNGTYRYTFNVYKRKG